MNNQASNVVMAGAMLAAVLSAAMPAQAVDWINTTNGFYSDGTHWLGGSPPTAGQSARFPGTGSLVLWDDGIGNTTSSDLIVENGNFIFTGCCGASGIPFTHTATNFAQIVAGGSLTLGNTSTEPMNLTTGGTLEINDGGSLTARFGSEVRPSSVDVGTFGAPSVINVDGAGSFIESFGSLKVGRNGSTGTVNYLNGSTNNLFLNGASLAGDAVSGSTGNINVTGGSQVILGSVSAGTGGVAGQSASILVDGAGSLIGMTGAAGFSLGAASNSTGSLTVSNGGEFYQPSPGWMDIYATGTVDILSGGRINSEAQIDLNSGSNFNYNSPGASSNIAILSVDAGSTYTQTDGVMGIDVLTLNGGVFDVNGGVLSVNDLATINATGTLSVDATSTFAVGGDVVVNGGTLDLANNSFATNWTPGQTLTAMNNAQIMTEGDYEFDDHTLEIQSGSTVTHNGLLSFGSSGGFVHVSGDADMSVTGPIAGLFVDVTVDGSGSTLNTGGGLSIEGSTLRVENDGAAFLGGLGVNDEAGEDGYVIVQSGGGVFVNGGVSLTPFDDANNVPKRLLDIDGVGSTFSQNGNNDFLINVGDEASVVEVHVTNSAEFAAGEGTTSSRRGEIYIETGATAMFSDIVLTEKSSITVDGVGSTMTVRDGSQVIVGDGTYFTTSPSVLRTINGGVIRTGIGTTIVGEDGVISNSDGIIQIGGGPLVGGVDDVTVTPGGVLKGNGKVSLVVPGFLRNLGGTIAPGTSIGTLTVEAGGGMTMSNGVGTVLEIEINGVGTAGVDYDLLDVSGSVKPGGTLDFVLDPGYTPTLGDEFDFLSAGDGLDSGVFEAVTNVVQAGNLGLAVRYPSFGFEIDMRVSIRGDTDFDDDVDTGDLTTAIIEFNGAGGNGNSWVDGDFDGDGDTDTGDLTVGIINFTGASAANPNVPDLVYDPNTGNVSIDADGADVISFSLQAGPFNAADFSELPAGLTDNIATQIGWTSFNLFSGLTGSANLGAILPAGLDLAGLEAALQTASYGLALSGGGGGGRLDIIIPEPGTLVLLGVGAVVMGRRRAGEGLF